MAPSAIASRSSTVPLHDPQPAVRAVGLAPGRVQLLDRDPQRRLRQVPVVHEGR